MKVARNISLALNALGAYAFYFCVGCYFFLVTHQDYAHYADRANLVTSLIGYLALVNIAFVLLNVAVAIIHGHVRRRRDKMGGAGAAGGTGRISFIFKLIMIPYFLVAVVVIGIVTVYGSLVSLVGLFMPKLPIISGIVMGTITSVILLVLLLLCYLQIVATSVHSTSDILLVCRRLNIHRGLRALYIVLQFLPIADIISLPIITNYLNGRMNK